jgi:GcrA cell cycle regulator
MRIEVWTDERTNLLKSLWAGGKTAAAIGARLGDISRSAVLGKIFRMRRSAAVEAPILQRQDAMLARRRARPRRYKKRGKTLLELTNTSCRWPFGSPGTHNFRFCGASGADLERGIAYCARHMRRAYCDAVVTNQAPASLGDAGIRARPAERRRRTAANLDRGR